jgi:hypothetical protein
VPITITHRGNDSGRLVTKYSPHLDMIRKLEEALAPQELDVSFDVVGDRLVVRDTQSQTPTLTKEEQGQRGTQQVSSPSDPRLVSDASNYLRILLSLYGPSDEHEIITALKLYGREKAARRLEFLYDVAAEDPWEDKIDLESLRTLAKVLTNYPLVPHPQISVSPEGHAVAEWKRDGVVWVMDCGEGGIVRYVALGSAVDEPLMKGEEQSSQLLPLISCLMGQTAWD